MVAKKKKNTPNVFQFVSGLKHILIGKLFKHSGQLNCEADRSMLLAELKRVPVPSAVNTEFERQDSDLLSDVDSGTVEELLTDDQRIIQDNVRYYLAGRLVHLFLKSSCTTCSHTLISEDQSLRSHNQFLALSSANDIPGEPFAGATLPSTNCLEFVGEMEQLFVQSVRSVLPQKGVLKILSAHLGATP